MNNNNSVSIIKLTISFIAPLTSVALMIFGSAFYTTFLSIYLDSEGYSRGEIGFIHSAFALGMLIGAFQMEKLINKVGHIQALAVFGSLATCSTLLQALHQSFASFVILRFFVGLSLAALYIVIESWMLYHSNTKTRGVVLSLYMICLYTSQSISQQLLSIIDIHSFTPYIASAIFTSLSIIPVGLSTFKIANAHHHEPIKFRDILKISPFGVSGCFISGLILSALYSFYPIFSVSKGIPSANLMSVTIAGGVILQFPIGKLSDYFERRKTLLIIVITALIFSISGIFVTNNSSTSILVLSFLMGGFLFALYPLSITQVCDHLDHAHVTTATALLLVSYGLGSIAGPIASSTVIDIFGINSIFIYFTILLMLLGGIGSYTTIRRPIIPLDEQTDFIPLPNMTPVGFEMDPRGDTEE